MDPRPVGEGRVRLQGVTRRFEGRTVIEAFSMEVSPGEAVGLVGANGSGKTTLLRLIAGTLLPDGGSIEIAGGDAGAGSSAFVPAGDRGAYWRLTVRDNLGFFAGIGSRRRDRDGLVVGAADALGISDLLDRRVEACSTGQRRRIAIARAVVACAPVLLVDEPFEGLDADGVARVGDLLVAWTMEGGSVVWAAPGSDHGPGSSRITPLRTESAVAEGRL